MIWFRQAASFGKQVWKPHLPTLCHLLCPYVSQMTLIRYHLEPEGGVVALLGNSSAYSLCWRQAGLSQLHLLQACSLAFSRWTEDRDNNLSPLPFSFWPALPVWLLSISILHPLNRLNHLWCRCLCLKRFLSKTKQNKNLESKYFAENLDLNKSISF